MQNHKFTIIIPTRERVNTLYWAIKTCLNQDYDNLEVIISDNFSFDNTREVVAEFLSDKRVKYINTGKRISMSHNWEFALNHVHEGFVSILGDDDGFLPNSITQINTILNEYNSLAIGWMCPHYRWPDFGFGRSNMLSVHLEDIKIQELNAQKELLGILDLKNKNTLHGILPSLYRNFVHIDAIKKVKAKTNSFFLSQIPDYYAGIALSAVIDNFLYCSRPFAISGGSGRSNGASHSNQHIDPTELNLFNNEGNIPYHKSFAKTYTNSVFSAECYLQAQDLFSKDFFKVDFIDIISDSLRETKPDPSPRYDYVIDKLFEMAAINGIPKNMLEDEIAKFPNKPINDKYDRIIEGYNVFKNRIDVDASKYKVTNVYEATLLYEKIYGSRNSYIRWYKSIIPTILLLKREFERKYL